MADFESDFAVDFEFGEKFDSDFNSESDFEPDIVFFKVSDSSFRSVVFPSSNSPLSVLFESPSASSYSSDSQTSRYIDIIFKAAALIFFHILPDANKEKYKEIEK
jgi:hypothetical protein